MKNHLRRRHLLLGGALVILFATFAAQGSQSLLPGAKPSSVQRLNIWGFDVYDVRLWSQAGFNIQQYTDHPFVLEISYLRNFEGPTIAKRSIEEMRRVGPFSANQEGIWLKAMSDIFPNVGKGDRLWGVYKPNEGVEFWSNQRRVGSLQDPNFGKLFFGIWLHESTSAPAIRQAWMNGL